jgi:hypothetical protein
MISSAAGSAVGVKPGDKVILTAPAPLDSSLTATAVIQGQTDRLQVRFCNIGANATDDGALTWYYLAGQ